MAAAVYLQRKRQRVGKAQLRDAFPFPVGFVLDFSMHIHSQFFPVVF
jgi:hypothetical protein